MINCTYAEKFRFHLVSGGVIHYISAMGHILNIWEFISSWHTSSLTSWLQSGGFMWFGLFATCTWSSFICEKFLFCADHECVHIRGADCSWHNWNCCVWNEPRSTRTHFCYYVTSIKACRLEPTMVSSILCTQRFYGSGMIIFWSLSVMHRKVRSIRCRIRGLFHLTFQKRRNDVKAFNP